jgi:hypothetical protein
MNLKHHTLRLLLMAATIISLAACARIGRPEGGEIDKDPPVFIRSNPAIGQLNFDGKKIDLYFDENIKVEDVINKVIVSPVQKQSPTVYANGKHMSVELRDTLQPNTTYTIDFTDAIRDLNESNILDGFAIDFATGDTRDSLCISGMLFQARNLEPAQSMLVGIHSVLADSAITTLPFDRIAKTNQYGQFIIRNLAPGTYRLYALNDRNGDYRWDRSEDVAFYDLDITPQALQIQVNDTLRSASGSDSIVVRNGVRYLPNDILMTWFNENYASQYLKEYTRTDSTRLNFIFGAPSDTFPTFTLLGGPCDGKTLDEVALREYSAGRDSITYWLNQRQLLSADTIRLAGHYLRTDTLNNLSWHNDTIRLITRRSDNKKKKSKKDEQAPADSLNQGPAPTFIKFSPLTTSSQDINRPLMLQASEPLASIDPDGINLDIMVDTLWTPLQRPTLQRDSANNLLRYSIHYDWQPGSKYRLTVDSLALRGIYGDGNAPLKHEFTVRAEDEYCTIAFNITGIPSDANLIVELLSSSDNPVMVAPAINGVASFKFVNPSTYYARAYVDANNNSVWDTGSIADRRQPEDVYYYPKKIGVKRNWDIQQSWDLNELPIDQQKPREILKNKPKLKAGDADNSVTDDDQDEDDFYNPSFQNTGSNSKKSKTTKTSGKLSSGSRGSQYIQK